MRHQSKSIWVSGKSFKKRRAPTFFLAGQVCGVSCLPGLLPWVPNGSDRMPMTRSSMVPWGRGSLAVGKSRITGRYQLTLPKRVKKLRESEERYRSLFERPVQTTKAKGMGFRLFVSKRIVDAQGGSISAKSEVGRGTTLTIQLPIRPAEVTRK